MPWHLGAGPDSKGVGLDVGPGEVVANCKSSLVSGDGISLGDWKEDLTV